MTATITPLAPRRTTLAKGRLTTRHVFDDTTDETGSRFCAVSLEHDGRLAIEIHDRGAGVLRHLGVREYDSFERFSLEQTEALRAIFGEDVVGGIGRQFRGSAAAFHLFLDALGLGHGELWSRVGD